MALTVKEAVKIAIENVTDLFEEQNISAIRLEEVDRNDKHQFLITVGFDRPSTTRGGHALSAGLGLAGLMAKDRAFKVVCVDQIDGDVLSVKDRILEQK